MNILAEWFKRWREAGRARRYNYYDAVKFDVVVVLDDGTEHRFPAKPADGGYDHWTSYEMAEYKAETLVAKGFWDIVQNGLIPPHRIRSARIEKHQP